MKFYVLELKSEWAVGKTPDSPARNLWSTAQEVARINGGSVCQDKRTVPPSSPVFCLPVCIRAIDICLLQTSQNWLVYIVEHNHKTALIL